MAHQVGDYELERRIGRGGMGVVYLGRHRQTGWMRAVKQPLVSMPDAETEASFLREAQAQGLLDHPNVTPIYESSTDENGTPYIVMEYFERGALRPLVGRLTQPQTGRVVVDVLRGLGHAHEQGVLHRDIKPSNLMRTRTGTVKIADFGIARILGEARSAQTDEGYARGEFPYIAPETLTGAGGDERADLFSVGVVAFELLTGAVPFAGTDGPPRSARDYLRNTSSSPSLERLLPGIDPGLAHWVASLLHRDPRRRPQTALDALQQFQVIAVRLWGADWETSTQLPGDELPPVVTVDPAPEPRLSSWSTVTALAPVAALARHALVKPRNLAVLGLGVVATWAAHTFTHVLRPWMVVGALAALYLGSAAVTFFDVAEADRVRRRGAVRAPAVEPEQAGEQPD